MFTQDQINSIIEQTKTWYELTFTEDEQDKELYNEYLQDVADACNMPF